MSLDHGLLVIDLQYGFSPDGDVVEAIRGCTTDYSVVVSTRFSPVRKNSYPPTPMCTAEDSGVIDVGHNLVLDRPGYGLNHQAISALKDFTSVKEWGLIGGYTGTCLLACALSLWDEDIPFHVVRPFCLSAPGEVSEAVDRIFQQSFGL